MPEPLADQHFKDALLDQIARDGNVAQFVSFGPDLKQRYSRIRGFEPNHRFCDIRTAIETLLVHSPDHRVNIRSSKPDSPHGIEFLYGITSSDLALQEIKRLAISGLFVIANETLDVNDGGVSGVVYGNVMEFAPGATPKIVEAGGIVSIDRTIAEALLQTVYGFGPTLPFHNDLRVEFSIHPVRRGFANEHTIIWEVQEIPIDPFRVIPKWPNDFSKFVGDKVFGLLIADAFGQDVPRTTVLSRNLLPFTFGKATGSDIKWLRTAPRVPEPGFFPTVRGWTDPFKLAENVAGHEPIPSILIQDEVLAKFSGGLMTDSDARPIVEGVTGFGDNFMLGHVGPTELDGTLLRRLEGLHETLVHCMGSIRVEWAFDGERIWTIQLQQETAVSNGQTIVPGEVPSEMEFEASDGLPGLRRMIELVQGTQVGIKVIGEVGMTSHIADLLRRHKVPSRIASKSD